MATPLGTLFQRPRRTVEAQDLQAAFQRAARARWGAHAPLECVTFRRGTCTILCPSPLWRTEALYHAADLMENLHQELPGVVISRVLPLLR